MCTAAHWKELGRDAMMLGGDLFPGYEGILIAIFQLVETPGESNWSIEVEPFGVRGQVFWGVELISGEIT